MQYEIVFPEQTSEGRHIGRVAADENDAILSAVHAASFCSNSRWMERSPDTGLLAETDVPKRSMAFLAAWETRGCPEKPR